jgi:hypothetical protein
MIMIQLGNNLEKVVYNKIHFVAQDEESRKARKEETYTQKGSTCPQNSYGVSTQAEINYRRNRALTSQSRYQNKWN